MYVLVGINITYPFQLKLFDSPDLPPSEEEHQEEDSDSDATVTKDLGKVPGKYLTKIS
jgi:hypothetical protein